MQHQGSRSGAKMAAYLGRHLHTLQTRVSRGESLPIAHLQTSYKLKPQLEHEHPLTNLHRLGCSCDTGP